MIHVSLSVAVDFCVDVIVRSNNNQVSDMTAHMSGLFNDLYKAIKTKSIQSLFG